VYRYWLLLHLRTTTTISTDSSADLDAQQLPMPITVFDGLR
jgi:hypothetical protein